MLSRSPCQNKDSMIQVFTQNDRHIIYSLSDILRICVHTLGSLPMELISGELLLNGAPASLHFDQQKHFSPE